MRLVGVQHLDVVGAHEEPMSAQPHLRWARVTRVDGIVPDVHGHLPHIYREAVPDQARSRGFCGSYWLADAASGFGLGVSLWEGPAELGASELLSRRRRGRLEGLLGCKVGSVDEYEALGVATRHRSSTGDESGGGEVPDKVWNGSAASGVVGSTVVHEGTAGALDRDAPAPTPQAVLELSRRSGLGTTLERPPGALLAVRGARTCQVVVLLEGRAAVLHRDDVLPVLLGSHFGAHAVLESRANEKTVLATSPVQVQVFSRLEFAALTDLRPQVAQDLLTNDLDR
jgi:hypothetical protein